jgi:hypothetical protein
VAAILKTRVGTPVRAFVVWEPVLWTDAFRPPDGVLARYVSDARATHWWDPDRSLSEEILRSPWTRKYPVRGGPLKIVWDWVACYPPGARWEADFPEPIVQDFPVVDSADRVGDWLGGAAAAVKQDP